MRKRVPEQETRREREREREGGGRILKFKLLCEHTHLVSPVDCSIPSNADVVGEIQREISCQVKEVFNTTIVHIHKRTL